MKGYRERPEDREPELGEDAPVRVVNLHALAADFALHRDVASAEVRDGVLTIRCKDGRCQRLVPNANGDLEEL